MKPLIAKNLLDLNDTEMNSFIATRIENRKITTGRRTARKTLSALSKAWNIAPTAILKAFESLGAGKMTLAFIATLLLISGCGAKHYYKLHTGEIVHCYEFLGDYCGMFLDGCDNGNTYYCQTNMHEMSDSEFMESLVKKQTTEDFGI